MRTYNQRRHWFRRCFKGHITGSFNLLNGYISSSWLTEWERDQLKKALIHLSALSTIVDSNTAKVKGKKA